MTIFAAVGAARGALVKVKCPHCGTVQARARGKSFYRCSTCHRAFDAAEATVEQDAPTSRPRPRRR